MTEGTAVELAALDEIEVTIEKIVAGGDGLARVGRVPVFVPRSAPGDRLRVKVVQRRPSYGRAEILDILEPSPERVEPRCPHYAQCGGCDLQHLDERAQVRWKAAATVETLERLGRIAVPAHFEVRSSDAWGYRLRTQLHGHRRRDLTQVGYHEKQSHNVVSVSTCPILEPRLEDAVVRLCSDPPQTVPERIDLAVGDVGSYTVSPPLPGSPRGPVRFSVGEYEYEFDGRCFFQAHRGLIGELTAAVVGDQEGECAVDLFAGVGLFSIPLATRYERVVAVESDSIAVRYARRNLRHNNVQQATVEHTSAEAWLAESPVVVDRVVVDPPRAGLSPTVRAGLLERQPTRLTYASCHPATLARDLKALGEKYDLVSLVVFDMFPQTGHVEVVAQLELRNATANNPRK